MIAAKPLQMSLDTSSLRDYVRRQLDHFFPDGMHSGDAARALDETLSRLEYCFAAIKYHYFRRDDGPYFDHLHGDHYAMFLYFLSNTLYRNQADIRICQKVFNLNKALHGIDVLYSVELPKIFRFMHCVGTVLGKASYSDYLFVSQDCTVGSNHGKYPVIGEFMSMRSGSAIIGNCMIGQNCQLSARATIMDRDLGPNQIYLGTPMSHTVKENRVAAYIWDV